MDARGLSAQRGDGRPRKNRTVHFALVTLVSGAAATAIAIGIESIPTVVGVVLPPPTPPAVEASALFPPVPAQQRVVDVIDPPPAAAPAAPYADASQSAPASSEPGDNAEPPESGDN